VITGLFANLRMCRTGKNPDHRIRVFFTFTGSVRFSSSSISFWHISSSSFFSFKIWVLVQFIWFASVL